VQGAGKANVLSFLAYGLTLAISATDREDRTVLPEARLCLLRLHSRASGKTVRSSRSVAEMASVSP
jgi:hypothetical protein